MESFAYTWTNTKTNQLYIGSHKGTPDDGYVCSSKPMLEDYMRDRSVFSRQIVATGTHEDMVAFEKALLMSVGARNDPQFYNKHNGNGHTVSPPGPHVGQFAGEKNPMYGKTTTQKQKDAVSKAFVYEGIEYPSLMEASRQTGIPKSTLWSRAKKS